SEGPGGRPEAQVYVVPLEKQDRDPAETEARGDGSDSSPDGSPRRGGPARATVSQPVKPVNIDWKGLKRRTRQVTRTSSPVFNYVPAQVGKTIVFVISECSGQ